MHCAVTCISFDVGQSPEGSCRSTTLAAGTGYASERTSLCRNVAEILAASPTLQVVETEMGRMIGIHGNRIQSG